METQISFAELLDWIEGKLSEDEAQRVSASVAASDTLREEVRWLRHFVDLGDEIVFAEPPPALHRQLRAQFDRRSVEQRARHAWQQLKATLSFDSHSDFAPAGVRGAGPAPERQLIYTTPLADVALNVQATPPKGEFELLGQVLPHAEELPLYSVQLLREGGVQKLTASNDLGEFSFSGLAPGTYQLVVSGDEAEVMITSLDLSA